MLVAKGRLDPGVDTLEFLNDVIASRGLRVIPITPVIAVLAQSSDLAHGDTPRTESSSQPQSCIEPSS